MAVELQELKLGERLSSYINFTYKIRDFFRDKADLEKEFSRKLDNLVKKHSKKRGIVEEVKLENCGMKETWDRILNDTLEKSKMHLKSSEVINQTVCDKLKLLAIKRDEARKRHQTFANKFQLEWEKLQQDLEKCKTDYDAACDLVEVAKERYEWAADDKSKERRRRIWHQEILDMNNAKNTYLVTIDMTEKAQIRHYEEDVPSLLLQFQDLGISHNKSIIEIWQSYIKSEQEILQSQLEIVKGTHDTISKCDASVDTKIPPPTQRLFDEESLRFKPCGLWKEDGNIVKDEYSVTFLGNKLEKCKRKAHQTSQEIKMRQQGLIGMEKLLETYQKNPLLGSQEEVYEEILSEKQAVFLAEINLFRYNCLMEKITDSVGTFPPGSCHHQFKPTYFAIPVACDYCQQTIWGLNVNNTGLSCKECAFNAHLKCEMKIPPQCTGVKRLLDKKRSVSDPYKRESLKRDIIVETCLSKPNANLLLNQSPSTLTFKDFYVDQVNQIDTSKALPTIVVKDLEPEKAKNEEIHNHLLPQYSQQEKHDEKHLSLTVSEPSLNKPALISQSVPGSRVKVLYDYYGTNSEEVTIYEGEDVIIIKLDDGTGWTTIMKTGTIGVVPTTYIAIDFPKDIVQSNTTLNETQLEMKRKSNKGTILYAYVQNGKEELSVNVGDSVDIIHEDDGTGWMMVSNGFTQGLVPAAYII